MNALSMPRRVLDYAWQGPPSLLPVLRLEWRFVVVRWASIFFVALGLLSLEVSTNRVLLGYGVLALAAVYNLAIQRLMFRRPLLIAKGYFTTIVDGMLNVLMLLALGVTLDSPIAYFLFSVVVSVAMRYGYGLSVMVAGLYIGVNGLQYAVAGRPIGASFVLLSGFLFTLALLASFLREEAKRAEAALEERLRQASLLITATGPLAASLDLTTVLNLAVEATSQLYGGAVAVLAPSSELGATDQRQALVAYPTEGHHELKRDLASLVMDPRPTLHSAPSPSALVSRVTMGSEQEAVLIEFVFRLRSVTLATLALAPANRQALPMLDPDLVESFAERVTLTIENALLYDALTRGTVDLQRAYSDLADAHRELLSVDEMKTTFLSNVSHELRTPLTSIRGFSELLLTYDDPEVRQEFLEIIYRETERLTRLVNDVLDVTKIDSGQMSWNMTALDLGDVLRETSHTCITGTLGPDVAFREDIADDLPPVRGDRDRVHQLIANLLTNAIKFTPKGTITLQAHRAGNSVCVAIKDTGIGIAPEDHERIFEKFQQVGPMLTNKPRGTGLGLAISRDIVLHHGGELWVESRVGAGSTFTFSLPIAVEIAPELEPTQTPVAVGELNG